MTVRDPISGGVARQLIHLRAQQDAVHDVRLLGEGTVEVAVVDGGDELVDAASVRLRQTEYPFRTYDGVVQPVNQGVVRFERVVEGPFTVEAWDVYGRGGRGSGEVTRPGETIGVRVRLTVTGVVRGHFRMPDDTPIPFGTVRLTSAGRAIGQVTTAGSGDVGSFAFDYVPGGPVRLDAEDPATARTGLAVGTIESEDQELTLDVRAQALGTVRGRVTGDGTPQPGALVQIVSGTYRVNTAADGDGWYEVPGIPEGRITVTASLDGGYLRATVSGTLAGEGSTLQLNVALRPSGEVRGTVTRAVGETPARAAVSVRTFGWTLTFTHHTTEDGRFDFTRVAAGLATLRADELGTIDRAEASAVVPEGGVVEVPLRLNGVGSLRGRALASDGVTPTGGYLALAGTSPRWDFWVRLGPDGLFHLPEVLAGPVTARLQVVAGGFTLYGTASATIVADQETVLDVRLQDSGTVTGVVRRAGGVPAFGATVSLLHERGTVHTQALADGRFTFRGVPLGAFTLVVHDEATAGRAKVRNLQIASNGQTVDLGTIELDAVPPTVTVIEPAHGGSRAPLGGMVVVDVADAQTGVDTSTFEVVYASGFRQRVSEFTVGGGRITGRLRAEYQVVGSNVLRFEVQDLAGNLTQQIVTYTATGATLQGHVRQHDGTPVPGAQVFVGFGSPSPVTADGAGAYVVGGLRGSVWVSATDPTSGISTVIERVHIFDGETRTKDIVFPAFGFINGVVRRANGAPAPGATVSCCWPVRSVTAGEGGAFNMGGAFSVGTHHLTASEPARGDRGTAAVTLSLPGQTVTTEIRLNGVGTVTATVRNVDGTPVTGALVRAVSSAVLGWNGAEQPTPANGTVSWSQALAGTITVTARDPQRNLAGQASGALADNGNLALTVTLEPAGSVVGTVYRAGGTAVAAGVDVTISGAANRTVRTDEQGRYAIPDVRMAAFQLLATDTASGDQGRASGVVSSTSPVTADITLAGVRAVRVLVRKASGDPAPGAQVTIGTSADIHKTYTGTAGGDGTVTIENVLAGTITLRAELWSSFSTGQATATLTPGVQPFEVTVTLEPVGTIRGRVFAADGVTPVPGVSLRIGVIFLGVGRGAYATSAADGSYEFTELPLRTGYEMFALVGGRTRARNPGLSLTSPGQVLVHDVVLVGVGTVSGVVTDPAGAPVVGAAVKLQISSGHYQGSFNTSTVAGGTYSLADVPVGPFTLTASRPGQSVSRVAEISQDGEALTIDLQLLSSFVTLEHPLTDGNGLTWRVHADGSVHGAQVVGNTELGAKLTLFENGTPRPFTGAGTQAATEEDKREVVIRQDGLAGLTVTRKAFVSATGYFLRYLDVLENPGSAPVTVDLAWESQHTVNTRVPSVVDSASGDATPGPDDGWLLLDDAETQDIYDASVGQFAPLGVVLAGPNGLAPSAVSWDAATHRLTYRWNGVTVAPGQKAAFLHLMTAQADRARGRASAVRLSQIPPEVLVGLAPEEATAVRNFLVPASLVSSVEPLPAMDGVVNGKLLGGDGQTPVPGRFVEVRSRSPHYGRPFHNGYGAGPDGSFELWGVLSGSVLVLPRVDFDLTSTHMSFVPNTGQSTSVHGRFPDGGVRNLADVPGRSIVVSSQFSSAYGAANAVDGRPSTHWRAAWPDTAEPPYNRTPFLEVVLPGEAVIHEVRVRCSLDSPLHLIRRARVQVKGAGAAVLWSADVDIPSGTGAVDVPVSPAVSGARSVRVTSLADGTYPTIAEIEIMGEGIPGPSRTARQNLLFTGRGVLEGRVLRRDQTPLAGFRVTATSGALDEWVDAASDGSYRFPVVPPGTYSVRAAPTAGGYSHTVPGVVVAPDQKTTQDLVFPSMGGLSGRTLSAANPNLPVNASLHLEGPDGLERDASGPNFAIPDLPPGSYTLKATDPRSQGAITLPVTITAGTITTQDVIFPPVGSVAVTARINGTPVNQALVQWKSAAKPNFSGNWRTDGAGTVTVTNVMGPSFTIRVINPANPHAIGEASAAMPVEGATVPVSVAVPGLGSVTGTVLSQNGVAQANATVRILHATEVTEYASVTANASGVFSFNNNVPAMPFRLRSELSGGMFDKAEIPGALTGPTLAFNGLVPRGVLTAARPAALWEYTLDQGDSGETQALRHALGADPAVADPRLEVYGPDGTLVAANDDRSQSNNDPLVQFTAPQAGTYLAVVKATGTGGYRLGSGLNARVFRPYQGVAVTGHVVREGSGTPVAGGIVRVRAVRAGGLSVTAYATTQPDGSFQFAALPAGATVTADLLEGGVAVAGAAGSTGAQGTTLDLTLTRPGLGRVEVRTTYRGSAFGALPVEVVSSNAVAPESLRSQAGATGADGRRVFAVVPAGTVAARATDPISGAPLETTGTLADGGTLALELAVAEGGDVTPPAAVGDLNAATPAGDAVRLTWTAPGDDGTAGTAAAYDLRYSTSPITETSFASATVAPAPGPSAAGTSQSFDLFGLAPNTAFHFALKSRDEAHNWSGLSNVAQASTPSVPMAGLKLWLKADAGVTLHPGTSYVSSWQDQSGQGNHATQATSTAQPLRVGGQVNGLPVLRFDGSTDWLAFTTRITNARSVFWVIREDSATTNSSRHLLGDTATGTPPWSSGPARQIWAPIATHLNVRSGDTRLNGALVNGTTTNRPTSMALISVVTAGDVPAAHFAGTASARWWGDLAELVIYDRQLGDEERRAVEAYLARKYGLYEPPLPAPAVSPDGGAITAATTVTLQVEAAAEIRYRLDGAEPTASSSLYTEPLIVEGRTTVKARAYAPGWSPSPVTTVTFLSSDDFSPASVAAPRLWVRADAGLGGSAGIRAASWRDQSGNTNDLAQADPLKGPILLPGVAAGLPALSFDGVNDWLGFTSRITNVRTVFWVVRESPGAAGYRYLLGDSTGYPWASGSIRQIWGGSADPNVRYGDTRVNGVLVDGINTNRPTALSVISLATWGDVPAANFARDMALSTYGFWWGELAELVIYDTTLSEADHRAVEEYLAARYGITLQ